jgi:hypothetical protein
LSVVSIEASSTQRLSDAKQLTVTLTLTDDKEDLPIRKQSGVVGLRRHRIQRICQQAQDHIKNRNGAVSVFIDPEKIELIKLAEDHSNRNALEGRVVQMIEENGKIRVVVDAGV